MKKAKLLFITKKMPENAVNANVDGNETKPEKT